ncbi:hypothetical protein D3C87_1640870 [compost metagenome]
MGLLNSLKNLLGIGDKYDTSKDGNLNFEDIKSAVINSADTNDDGKVDLSDAKDLPAAVSELKDRINGSETSKKTRE